MAAAVRRHDERFLAEIKVERWLGRHEGRLPRIRAPPMIEGSSRSGAGSG